MTVRQPKKWRRRPLDPWWEGWTVRPEVNPVAPTTPPERLVDAVLERFPGAKVVKARPGEPDQADDKAYLESVVLAWRDMPFQDSRDLAEIDRLRALYAHSRWWRWPRSATPVPAGARRDPQRR